MKHFFTIIFTFIIALTVKSQNKTALPYYEIPTSEENYTAAAVVGRMIDGLGFRYYWSTDGLTDKDLQYKPNEKGRTTQETITHLYDLSNMMLGLTKTTFKQNKDKTEMTFTEMREQTLFNFEALSKKIKATKDLSSLSVIKDGEITIPFFNVINGPIADAIWHTGQVATFRRSSGNPINSKINHFSGTVNK